MLFAAEEAKNSSKTNQVLSKKSAKSGIGKAAASAFAYAIFALRLPVWFYKIFFLFRKSSGLPKAEVFGRSRSFSKFGLQLPKFYSKHWAFCFDIKMSCS